MKPRSGAGQAFLTIGSRIRVLPIIHGSGDYAVRVRQELLESTYDCVAVPLPPSFQEQVEDAVQQLPAISAVVQRDAEGDGCSYVPIDPCQGVIAALRLALGERVHRAFIDRETPWFEPTTGVFPDPYALKKVSPEAFAAAVLPTLPPPMPGQHTERIAWMAQELRRLERRYRSILLVCSLLDWPWIRDAYRRKEAIAEPEAFLTPLQTFPVDPRTLLFFLGELPFLTGLYERGRIDLGNDENLSIDGIKELVLDARERLKKTRPRLASRVTPQMLSIYFRYVRSLALVERRLTPSFYDLVIAARQTAGDEFALAVAETAREYPSAPIPQEEETELLRMSVGRAEVPLWGAGPLVSRLPGQAVAWKTLHLKPNPTDCDQARWESSYRWNPHSTCTWPTEDVWRENFSRHVQEQAQNILGHDLARTEKFTTSVMDGLDIRETLRHSYKGDLYVKILPPRRGSVEVVCFLFDVPADPRKYPLRSTWYAEHDQQSTLSFFATDHMRKLVGPGIGQAEYGGTLLQFPPRPYPDIWTDPRLDFVDTLEERLLAGGLFHTRERHVVVVSPCLLLASWHRLARRFGKKLIHLPMSRFSSGTIERLRHLHVLNGMRIRSYAADFIRDFS